MMHLKSGGRKDGAFSHFERTLRKGMNMKISQYLKPFQPFPQSTGAKPCT